LEDYMFFVESAEPKTWSGAENPFITMPAEFSVMRILKLATALPEKEYSTEKLLKMFPCQLPEGVRENVLNLGVSKRYLLDHAAPSEDMSEEGVVSVCSEACEKALQKCGLSAGDIGYFVAAYDANPFLSPGLSHLLVHSVGFDPYISHVNAQGAASIAFPKALELAGNHLAAHPKDYALICVSGVGSYWFQNQVRGMKDVMEISKINAVEDEAKRRFELRKWMAVMEFFLFGDGAAACVVANEGRGLEVEKSVEVTNVEEGDYLAGYARLATSEEPFMFGFHSHLDKRIPELGVKYSGLVLRRLFGEDVAEAVKGVKKWAVHTGSEKILYALAERNGIQPERIRESHEVLREYGNLAGASLPFILERIVSAGKLEENDIVLMLGYGWGFSASASVLKSKTHK
jgi:predicted naringenin-chalcone synthase